MIPNLGAMRSAARQGQREFWCNIWRDTLAPVNTPHMVGMALPARFLSLCAASGPQPASYAVAYRIRIRLKPGVRL